MADRLPQPNDPLAAQLHSDPQDRQGLQHVLCAKAMSHLREAKKVGLSVRFHVYIGEHMLSTNETVTPV